MKKIYLWAMLSAMAVSSCSQNERLEDPAEWSTPLGFSTYVGTTTKATELVDDDFKTFVVEAYSSTNAVASATDATTVTHIPALTVSRTDNETAWSYNGAYYWPSSGFLNFYAYAGTGVTYAAPATEDKTPTLTYTASATIADQIDLIAASAVDQTSSSNANGAVKLAFKHILTQIHFSVVGAVESPSDTPYSYIVSSITLKGVKNVGTYTYADATSVSNTTKEETTTLVSTGIGTWSLSSDVADVADYAVFAPSSDSDYITAEDITAVAVSETTNGSLMLIPQEFGDDSGVSVVVAYKVMLGDTEIADFTTNTKSISFDNLKWEAGQNLRYNLTLPIDATLITFTTDALESWETEQTAVDVAPASK